MTTHGEIIVYQTKDGNVRLDVPLHDETVWLTQAMMAELFACSVDNIRELDLEATSEDFSMVRTEGTRQVTRPIRHYNLDAIISDAAVLAGHLPTKQLRLVQAWIELRRDELTADWELAVTGENPYKIDPL